MIKAYFVIRVDIDELTEAKLAIQVGHGTDLIHLNSDKIPNFFDWLSKNGSNRRKIVLRVKSKEKLKNLINILKDKKIPHFEIYDSGYTVFKSKTLTGIVICPIKKEKLPSRIRRLRLWE